MKPSHMNLPPAEFIRVPHRELESFVAAAGRAAGLPEDKAALLARLLVENDLRGVFSHGSRQIAHYVPLMLEGTLNSEPQVQVVREAESSVLVDGDGGLGYFPAYEGALRAVEKAKRTGVCIAVTRNHGHIGAAGIYARLTLAHDLLTFVTSGHQLHLEAGEALTHAAGGSPFAFTSPAGQEDDLVLDFGTMHDLYDGDAHREDLIRMVPGLVFRHIGMGAICQSWGGFLAGVPLNATGATRRFGPGPGPQQPAASVSPPADGGERRFPGAYQGSLLITFGISMFMPPEQFRSEMDAYVRSVRQMAPLPGFDDAFLPGGIEAIRERQYRREGIPVGGEHQRALDDLAAKLGLQTPWQGGRT